MRFALSLPPFRARRATASHARRTGATTLSRHHAMLSQSTTKAMFLPAGARRSLVGHSDARTDDS
jgi:hypothetical protein